MSKRAVELLRKAADTMEQRAKERGEEYQNVMPSTLTKFYERTGKLLTPGEGWVFMQCLKEARADIQTKEDDLIDLIAYKSLELAEMPMDSLPERYKNSNELVEIRSDYKFK